VSTPVSLVDVTPTILQLAGVTIPERTQGLSLLPLVADADAAPLQDRVLFTQQSKRERASFAIRRGKDKWLFVPGKDPQIYDLEADPKELHPRTDPALLAEGRHVLDQFRKQGEALRSDVEEPAQNAPLDPEVEDKLRRLGYIE